MSDDKLREEAEKLQQSRHERFNRTDLMPLWSAALASKRQAALADSANEPRCGFYVNGVRCKLHVDHRGPCEPAALADTADAPPEVRPEVLAFGRLMETQLRFYDPERGDSWRDMSPDELVERLESEFMEVTEEVDRDSDREALATECADLANFAMFLATVHGEVSLAAAHEGG